MIDLTPQQENQLKSWSSERDNLLREISILRGKKGDLIKQRKEEGIDTDALLLDTSKLENSKTILEDKIKELNKEIFVLDNTAKEKKQLVSDITELKRQKNDLILENSKISNSILSKEEIDEKAQYLSEIAALKIEKANLTKTNEDLGISNIELTNSIHISIGRIEELKTREKDFTEMMTVDNTEKILVKTRLQEQVYSLEKEVKFLEDKKKGLTEDIVNQKEIYSDLFDKAGTLREIVSHVVTISDKNMIKLDQQSSILVDKVKEIVAISTENINKHNVILDEIPKLFVELKRKSLEREPLKKIKHTP